jgi:hypothetical protein
VNTADGRPLAHELITMSAPSKDYHFMISTTDSSGRYYINTSGIQSDVILLKLFNSGNSDYTLQVNNPFLAEYKHYVPGRLQLDTTTLHILKQRSLSVQVENAFYSVKKDSIVNVNDVARFFLTADKVYRLDDFTRFPTMEDIFREIIPEIVVRIREGNFSIVMMNSNSGYRFANGPLILLDGIPIENTNVMMGYDPALIERITIVTKHYYYGGLETDGIISIETYNGNAKDLPLQGFQNVPYITPLARKIYYSPKYEDHQKLTRIPDFRTQLYWEPSVRLSAGETKKLSFFTGDLAGEYFIEISGTTSSGKILFSREIFSVK